MKDKINKTNAARLLDKAKVKYELIPYEVDENDLSAPHVAESLGENIDQVFKTLVLHGDKSGYFVCVIPGEHEVDLKMAAKVSGNKKCDLIPMKDLLPLTGYIRGGCSPIGMKKLFRIPQEVFIVFIAHEHFDTGEINQIIFIFSACSSIDIMTSHDSELCDTSADFSGCTEDQNFSSHI